MYKYTSILSDSYRLNSASREARKGRSTIQFVNQLLQSYQMAANRHNACSDLHCNQKKYIAPYFQSQQQMTRKNFDATFHSSRQSAYQRAIKNRLNSSLYADGYQKTKRTLSESKNNTTLRKEQKDLKNRLQRLADLGERHQQALKTVQLQRKLKEITNKYTAKDIYSNETRFLMYRKQLDDNKKQRNGVMEGFSSENTLQLSCQNKMIKPINPHRPQQTTSKNEQKAAGKRLIEIQANTKNLKHSFQRKSKQNKAPRMDKTQKQVNIAAQRIDWQQYNNKIQSYNAFKQEAAKNTSSAFKPIENKSQKGNQAIQKLSSLQQKIESSVKPYLNM